MFKFGWLTVTPEDLAVWEQFPNAAFTLVTTAAATDVFGEEFRLGTFAAFGRSFCLGSSLLSQLGGISTNDRCLRGV